MRRSSRTPRRRPCCTSSACDRRVGKIAWQGGYGCARLRAILPTRLNRQVPQRRQRAGTPYCFFRACGMGALPTLQVFALSILALAVAGLPARAQASDQGEIHGLKLGLKAASMALSGFGELACGSNGG